MVPIHPKLLEAGVQGVKGSGKTRRLWPDGGDYTNRPAHQFLKAWNRAAKDIGPYSFHCWRLYANDEMARAGVDITDRERIIGHTSGRTQAAYTAVDLERYARAVSSIR